MLRRSDKNCFDGYRRPAFEILIFSQQLRIEYHGSTPWVYPAESQPAPGQSNVQSISVETENGASTTRSPYHMTRTPIRERISGATDRSSSTAPGTKDQGIQGLRQTLLEELLEDCTNTFKNNAKRQANIGTTRLKPSMDGNEDTISLSQPKKTPICTNIGILDDLSIRLPDYGMFVPSIALSACVGLSGDELLQQVIKSGLKVRGVRLLHSGEPDYRLVKLRLVLHGLIVHKSQENITMVPVRSCTMLLSIGQHCEQSSRFEQKIDQITRRYQERISTNVIDRVNC
ncbi:uncharacterized protein LOC111248452 isoform X1 [Varroa destructor]|uniref:Uncharacterized protein n=1 Tax=Varroa destructor TaxID=109461 RepID=A0A7M7JTK8_VARDE|nr:uncharacterized protein LOC111248452 isoform X1 [Varroa destructor]